MHPRKCDLKMRFIKSDLKIQQVNLMERTIKDRIYRIGILFFYRFLLFYTSNYCKLQYCNHTDNSNEDN